METMIFSYLEKNYCPSLSLDRLGVETASFWRII